MQLYRNLLYELRKTNLEIQGKPRTNQQTPRTHLGNAKNNSEDIVIPQAFEGLRNSNRKVRHPNLTLAVADHNVPTTDRTNGIADQESKIQVDTLEKNRYRY